MTVRLAVLASGRGSNVRAIVEAAGAGVLDAEVALVLSDRADAPVLDFARERGIPARVVPLEKGGDRGAWNARLTLAIDDAKVDYVVLAGFMRVLSKATVDAYARRIVNVHPSLLPAFPGAHGPRDALRAGVRITGCTVHLVDEGVDTGTILAQAAVRVHDGDDEAALHARIQRAEHRLLPRVLSAIASGELEITQDSARWARKAEDDLFFSVPEA